MQYSDGQRTHFDGRPWWLLDMRPQGYLGRAYAARYGHELGLPNKLSEWSDTHALQALLLQGHDAVGNLLIGDKARDYFLTADLTKPIDRSSKKKYLRKWQNVPRKEICRDH